MPHPDMNANYGNRDGEHPDEGLLHEWLDDQLSPTDAADMQAHVAKCAECGARVAEARGLIAASHRILSALDEVPSGVIPANVPSVRVTHEDTVLPSLAGVSSSNGITSIDDARKTARSMPKRVLPWQRIGSIAALLLVAATVVRFGMGDDVTVPMPSVASDSTVAAPVAPMASAAPVAEGASREQRAQSTGAAEKNDAGISARKSEQVASTASKTNARAAANAPPVATAKAVAPVRGVDGSHVIEGRRPVAAMSDSVAADAMRKVPAVADAQRFVSQPVTTENLPVPNPGSGNSSTGLTMLAGKTPGANITRADAGRPTPPPSVVVASGPPPAVIDQIATRADSLARGSGGANAGAGTGAGFGGGGRGGRGGGRAGPPAGAAAAATAGTVSNAPPVGATTSLPVAGTAEATSRRAAALPMASPPPATSTAATSPVVPASAATRDSSLRAEAAALVRAPEQARRADTTANASRLLLRSATGQRLADASAPRAIEFDSVTLIRTACGPNCESTTLHIDALGVVRYAVDTGNTQRVVMSQLSAPERAQLRSFLLQSFSTAALQRGRTTCASSAMAVNRRNARERTPTVQLFVDFPANPALRAEQRCTKSESELRDIGGRVDEIAGTIALKNRIRP